MVVRLLVTACDNCASRKAQARFLSATFESVILAVFPDRPYKSQHLGQSVHTTQDSPSHEGTGAVPLFTGVALPRHIGGRGEGHCKEQLHAAAARRPVWQGRLLRRASGCEQAHGYSSAVSSGLPAGARARGRGSARSGGRGGSRGGSRPERQELSWLGADLHNLIMGYVRDVPVQ